MIRKNAEISSKKKIKFRPFFVKEERALLAAQESEDVNVMLNTLNQIVKNCVEPKTICDSLTIFDIEYLFIKIRSKSVDEFSNIIVACDSCKKQSPYRISLEEVNVVTPPEHTTSIKISGDIVVMMKYPTIEELMEIENNDAISSLDSFSSSSVLRRQSGSADWWENVFGTRFNLQGSPDRNR